jgi:hypothetical protein
MDVASTWYAQPRTQFLPLTSLMVYCLTHLEIQPKHIHTLENIQGRTRMQQP